MAANAGRMPVQIRFAWGSTGEDYVTRQAWRNASLPCCPKHPEGGCGFSRHGTYERVSPPGTKIARWYCPKAHQTFSLLPDHLAARFPGTLLEIETVVAEAERAPSLEVAADRLRPDGVTLTSALRWLRRRVRLIRQLLRVVNTLFPEELCGCQPVIGDLRGRLGCVPVLLPLRERYRLHLTFLPRPLGFIPPLGRSGEHKARFQQRMGTDPPGRRK